MRYRESKEQSSELLRLALPLMARQTAAHHPVSYALWYEHVAGLNTPLSVELGARLQANDPLTEDDTYRLHARFISARDVELLERLQAQLGEAIDDTARHARLASKQSGRYGLTLQQAQTQITAAGTVAEVGDLIVSLLDETQRMQAYAMELSRALEAKAAHVRHLADALAHAQTESVLDPLSGLNNRLGFERAAQTFSGPNGELTGAALLVADIDHFKQVNDTYGHVLGDKVIKAVAGTLLAHIKGRDIAARIGGEEFAILLPETTLEGARVVAEQLRAAVAKGRIHQSSRQGSVGSITLSVGAAVAVDGETLEHLMERADQALYRAKREGRNRVCVALTT